MRGSKARFAGLFIGRLEVSVMSTIDESGPAFPLDSNQYGAVLGMSLRDYFAAKAMASMIRMPPAGGWNVGLNGSSNGHISEIAFAIADAMLIERAK
jgi:hypothetical protein